jgi:hypothetical protein
MGETLELDISYAHRQNLIYLDNTFQLLQVDSMPERRDVNIVSFKAWSIFSEDSELESFTIAKVPNLFVLPPCYYIFS